jgi:hypothetical protein
VARAKRTARADARRRYRAAIVDSDLDGADDGLDADGTPPRSGEARSEARSEARTRAATTTPQRPSITGAFRNSFRPVDLRGDLQALPRLLLTRTFLIPLDLSGLAFIGWVFSPSAVTTSLLQWVSYPFPLAPVFAVGYFATRASYLLAAIVSGMGLAFALPLLTELYPDPGVLIAVIFQAVVFGALFGAAAAWYRRFLNRANPNRSTPTTTSRRTDGKIAKRPQPRPLLARRR